MSILRRILKYFLRDVHVKVTSRQFLVFFYKLSSQELNASSSWKSEKYEERVEGRGGEVTGRGNKIDSNLWVVGACCAGKTPRLLIALKTNLLKWNMCCGWDAVVAVALLVERLLHTPVVPCLNQVIGTFNYSQN